MANFLSRLFNRNNKYNNAFFSFFGGGEAKYDYNKINYIEKGYNINPLVYAPVNARTKKFKAVPFDIVKIEDKESMKQYNNLIQSTKYDLTPLQKIKSKELYNKAFTQTTDFVLENPNPIQTWGEFKELFEIYLATCGEVYVYKLSPEGGMNAGEPIALYILPSHYMEIVVKEGYKIEELESPVSHYMLIEGDQYTKFKAEEIIHIKYPNPNYDIQATNLYGFSPLRACYKNIMSSNEALDLNNKTMKSGGAFGFLHGKTAPLTQPQGKAIKEKLTEMDAKATVDRFAKIGVASEEMAFTRISLNTDELKPFDFLKFDLKQICNALGWDDKLLNNEEGAKYDNYISAQKRVLLQTIVPDLDLFKMMFNKYILPLYKKYNGYTMTYDLSNLPEMQEDMKSLVEWVTMANDKGLMSKNEGRESMGLEKIDNPLMDEYTVIDDVLTLEQSLDDFPSVQ